MFYAVIKAYWLWPFCALTGENHIDEGEKA